MLLKHIKLCKSGLQMNAHIELSYDPVTTAIRAKWVGEDTLNVSLCLKRDSLMFFDSEDDEGVYRPIARMVEDEVLGFLRAVPCKNNF